MDSAEQLQRLYVAGFEVLTFDRYPNSVAVAKGNCIALMQPTPNGLMLIGQPGWRMGEIMGVLVTRNGQKLFQAKSEEIEATPEHLTELQAFTRELQEQLNTRA
jgi:hypothetical protein